MALAALASALVWAADLTRAPLVEWRIRSQLSAAAESAPAAVAPALADDIEMILLALEGDPRLRAQEVLYEVALLRPHLALRVYSPERIAAAPGAEMLAVAEALLAADPLDRRSGPHWTRRAAGPSSLLVEAAARRAGVDSGFLLKAARRESGLNPYAAARSTSARGLFQFIDQTWLHAVAKWGPRHGLGREAAAIEILPGGRAHVADASAARQILLLRYDPDLSARMAAELAVENDGRLTQALGRRPSAGELYAAHLLGVEGAVRLIRAAYLDPARSAADLLPAAAVKNMRLFYSAGRPRSASELLGLLS